MLPAGGPLPPPAPSEPRRPGDSLRCTCCGSPELRQYRVMWPELISQWELGPEEVAYTERQQALMCTACGSNLRSMTLAKAIMRRYEFPGLFGTFVVTPQASALRVLEINEAGTLTPFLQQMPGHLIVRYPQSDMTRLAFADGSFDLVVHSDTLEHVPDPVLGLSECRRVLKPGGACAFTVPIVVDRLSRSRRGLPPSYHGSPDNPGDCLVHMEYGADAWRHVFMAGFGECRIVSFDHPAAHALVALV